MPVISEKYVMEIKIISSQPKVWRPKKKKLGLGAKGYVWLVVAVKLKKEKKRERKNLQ